MPDEYTMRAIAHVRSDFSSKFGIPRQSGVVPELEADVVFTPEFRNPDAFRGLERCTHIWLIWLISETCARAGSPRCARQDWAEMSAGGVFATRSPFRPNPIGLSCVRLKGIDLHTPEGPVLHILGADLMDGTPILDVKPLRAYIRTPYRKPQTVSPGRAGSVNSGVECAPGAAFAPAGGQARRGARRIGRGTPGPRTSRTPERVYGMGFAGFDIRFTVSDGGADRPRHI